MLQSASALALKPAELHRIEKLISAYSIEWAEINASAKQLRFQDYFFNRSDGKRRLDIFVAMGGNRSGKSVTCGPLCMIKFVRDRARRGDAFWCVAPTADKSIGTDGGQQRFFWEFLPRWMFGEQSWDHKKGFTDGVLVLPTRDGGKCTVKFLSSEQSDEIFEAGKITGIWCDERLPEAKYDRLLARIIDLQGFILYSDIPEQFWQMERLANAQPEAGIYYQHLTMYDNQANLPDGEIDLAASRMTEQEKRMRIRGEFGLMEGIVYREFIDKLSPDGHLVEPFEIPRHWPRWRLLDYGGSAPTACGWMAINENETAYFYREHYRRGDNVATNARAILAMSQGETYRNTLIDPVAFAKPPAYYGAAKSVAEQYAEAGLPCEPWPLINVMGEHACVQRVRYRFEVKKLRIFTTCVEARRETRAWKYKTDANGKPLASDAYEHDNNHLLDGIKGFFATSPCFAGDTVRVTGGE